MPRRVPILLALLFVAVAWLAPRALDRGADAPLRVIADAPPSAPADTGPVLPLAAKPAVAPAALATPASDVSADAPASEPFQGMVGEWVYPAARAPIEFARERARAEGPAPDRLDLPLRPGQVGTMRVRRFEATEEDGGVFTGELEGHPGSTVVLSYVGLAQSGVVLLPAEHRAFNYRAGDDGVLRVTELDTRHAPNCGQQTPLLPPNS